MKKRFSKPFLLTAILVFSIVFSLLCLFLPFSKIWYSSYSFKSFYSELFRAEMLSDTLSMHYTLAKPENYGIYHYEPVLSGINSETTVTASEALDRLSGISRKHLSSREQYQYDCLQHQLGLEKTLQSFEYYIEPCSLNGGALSNLIVLLSEYPFYRERDVKEYLSLLSQTGRYLEKLTEYENKRNQRGLSYSRDFYRKTASISNHLANLAPQILDASFQSRLDELSIPDSRKEAYREKHSKLTSQVLSKACMDFAEKCSGLGQEESLPLCSLEDGKVFYSCLLKYKTGVNAEPETLVRVLSKDIVNTYKGLQKLLKKYSASDYSLLLEEPKVSLPSDPKTVLTQLEQEMGSQYPKLTGANPLIKTVSSGMESLSAPAFYLSTPMDSQKASVIYINPESTCSPLDLFTTLAHEGFPGHLYQDLYQHQSRGVSENKLYTLLNFTGYYEGWAIYNEFLAYNLAASQAKKQEDALLADQIHLEALERRLSMAVLSLSDILIHYYGMNQEGVGKTILRLGYPVNNLSQIYQFLVENPVYYPSYYVSFLGLMDLRAYIKEEAGASFTPLLFHRYYLENGPGCFSLMKQNYS